MYKFSYSTTSDGDRIGPVSSDFIADRLISRGIQSIATTESETRLSLGLSDGAKITFMLKADRAEVVYQSVSKK
jgi:hypothetical protein